jgi:hypothetical protein
MPWPAEKGDRVAVRHAALDRLLGAPGSGGDEGTDGERRYREVSTSRLRNRTKINEHEHQFGSGSISPSACGAGAHARDVHWLETQHELIKDVGLQNYLQSQMSRGEARLSDWAGTRDA